MTVFKYIKWIHRQGTGLLAADWSEADLEKRRGGHTGSGPF